TEAHGNMIPEDKSAYNEERQAEGQTIAIAGDGIKDRPSPAQANNGNATESGTEEATETSDDGSMKSDIRHITHALAITKSISSNMIQNIVIAIGVVVILLAGLLFSDWMNMSIGMLAHELSIFVVILNGMRLMRYRV